MFKKAYFILVIIGFLTLGFFVSENNYIKHREIKFELVSHPENLPKPELAAKTTFGFSNVIADMYWLQTIQYIGGNAISSEYKKFLFAILDLVTTLNPYFENPYIIGMLLLPWDDNQFEGDDTEEAKERYTSQAVTIWLKWIENFCDKEKIALIDKEFDLEKLWSDPQYKNPCQSDLIPFSLAFVYYFYLNQPLEAAKYYKVSSAIDDSLEWAKVMSAIMQWKGWDREKSIYMFLNMGRTVEDDLVCRVLSTEIEKIMNGLSAGEFALSGKLISDISKVREDVFGEFNEETKEIAMSGTSCQNFVNKAVRELNLLYLELANKQYISDNWGIPAKDWEELLEAWYIDYNPIDFQQFETYGIRYDYNDETGNFDYWNGGL